MYPDAKVVLSNRDVDKWFQYFPPPPLPFQLTTTSKLRHPANKNLRSVSQTIDWRYHDPILYILSFLDRGSASWANMTYKMWAIFSRGDFAKHGKAAFEEHYAHVREIVPKERLLEYRVQEGWEPLCRFLGTEVPAEEFPRGNEPEAFRRFFRRLDREKGEAVVREKGVWVLGVMALVVGLVGVGWMR